MNNYSSMLVLALVAGLNARVQINRKTNIFFKNNNPVLTIIIFSHLLYVLPRIFTDKH